MNAHDESWITVCRNVLTRFLNHLRHGFANLILVFLETSGSPMDPEPHDGTLSRHFLQGSTSGVSGSESNVDHDVRKPLGMPLLSGLGFDGSCSPSFKGLRVASNTMQREGLFPLHAPWNGDLVHWKTLSRVIYAREDSNPQPKVP